jgi:hypothetical protein
LSARVTNNVTTAAVANYDFGGSDEHALNVPVNARIIPIRANIVGSRRPTSPSSPFS